MLLAPLGAIIFYIGVMAASHMFLILGLILVAILIFGAFIAMC